MWEALYENGTWSDEIWNRRKNGEAYPEWLSISSILNHKGEVTQYVAVFHDITDMKQKEQQIRHQALHDALTDLPNRTLLTDRLSMALRHAERHKMSVAVLFFDLDNFKNVNDSLGHSAGDKLLQETASRVSGLIRDEDTLSRLGGDEFVIVMEERSDERRFHLVAQRLLSSFDKPFRINEHELYITLSIGIALYPEDGRDPDELVKHADLAMYRAKEQGKNSYYLYTPSLNRKALERIALESSLRRAIERDELFVVFQPKVNSETGKTTGVEALVRWKFKNGETVLPNAFVPVAEESGLVVPMDFLVLRKACITLKPLIDGDYPELGLSVNFSPKHMVRPEMVSEVREILKETGFPPGNLEIEITETAVMTEFESAAQKLEELASLGIKISIDDFGTGYSSLYYLRKLPIHKLKIDRSFVRDIHSDQGDAEIVTTIIAMAKNLKLHVIAEGVETLEQACFLRNHGCDEFQGEYYSFPLMIDDLIGYLSTESVDDTAAV